MNALAWSRFPSQYHGVKFRLVKNETEHLNSYKTPRGSERNWLRACTDASKKEKKKKKSEEKPKWARDPKIAF
jgi:hypothetical protein